MLVSPTYTLCMNTTVTKRSCEIPVGLALLSPCLQQKIYLWVTKKLNMSVFFFFLMGGVFVCFVLFGFTSLNILLSLYGRNEFFVAKMMTEMK